jgi:excisionase family DNA binding protein
MPPTKELTTTANGPATGDVLTLAEAAAYLRLPEADVVSAIHAQGLPGRLVGGEWRLLKDAVQHWLGTPLPRAETRKALLLTAAGSFADDPDLTRIVEEAMRLRGRSPGEGE